MSSFGAICIFFVIFICNICEHLKFGITEGSVDRLSHRTLRFSFQTKSDGDQGGGLGA